MGPARRVTAGPRVMQRRTRPPRLASAVPAMALLPLLTVEGVYTTPSGSAASLPLVGVPLAGGSWSLQLPFISASALLELGDTTMMRFRIRAAIGAWQVDDFYVDPVRRY